MNAEIINVGNELLSGNTLNINSHILSKVLLSLGIATEFNTVIGDMEAHILNATEVALKRAGLIIYTGGLGPTRDDFTKEVVCKAIGVDLILNEEILKNIKAFFDLRNMNMTENNIKQSYVPKDSVILVNKNGTAPGFFINHNNKFIVLLPGPPKEMEPIFMDQVVPLLRSLIDTNIISKTIKTVGIGESQLEMKIEDIVLQYEDVAYIATYAKSGLVDIRINIDESNQENAERLLNEIYKKIDYKLSEYIYSYEDETLEEAVFHLLKDRGLKIGFCESCTGGLVSSKITKLNGASKVFDRSIVTYSNQSKVEEVHVEQSTLDKYGAVSRQTAVEMAKGLLSKSDIDIAVSITGLAGPEGGSENKPVGLVYICLATKKGEFVEKNLYLGSRNYIQERASISVFNLIRKHILTFL